MWPAWEADTWRGEDSQMGSGHPLAEGPAGMQGTASSSEMGISCGVTRRGVTRCDSHFSRLLLMGCVEKILERSFGRGRHKGRKLEL